MQKLSLTVLILAFTFFQPPAFGREKADFSSCNSLLAPSNSRHMNNFVNRMLEVIEYTNEGKRYSQQPSIYKEDLRLFKIDLDATQSVQEQLKAFLREWEVTSLAMAVTEASLGTEIYGKPSFYDKPRQFQHYVPQKDVWDEQIRGSFLKHFHFPEISESGTAGWGGTMVGYHRVLRYKMNAFLGIRKLIGKTRMNQVHVFNLHDPDFITVPAAVAKEGPKQEQVLSIGRFDETPSFLLTFQKSSFPRYAKLIQQNGMVSLRASQDTVFFYVDKDGTALAVRIPFTSPGPKSIQIPVERIQQLHDKVQEKQLHAWDVNYWHNSATN